MNWLISLDRALFHKINRDWSASFLDAWLPHLTDLHKQRWFLYTAAALAAWWVWKERKPALKALVVVALAIGMTDFVNHRLIKPTFNRARPEKAGLMPLLRTPSHAGLSFPSNHAANMGAAASALSYAYPAWAPVFALAAGLVAYSRVYCGVHFPADVLMGLLLGFLIGRVVAYLMLGSDDRPAGKPKKSRKKG
ncbi:MAG: phosphatase PAP2 family protein [Elusimicrobiota bacterium]|nr:phosphatase PAP2 family protein [Elusimicrobiota bacterium]